jgi:MSHA pilin protein MshA
MIFRRKLGFTLIELLIVMVILALLAVIVIPKFLSLKTDIQLATLQTMKAAIKSTHDNVQLKIRLNPEKLNIAENRFTLDNGQHIRVRAKYPDGRWNNTFTYLVDFEKTAQINHNLCDDTHLSWCVRQRGGNWFYSRGLSASNEGRGFVIYPFGYNLNTQKCYLYYMNNNAVTKPFLAKPAIIGLNISECE